MKAETWQSDLKPYQELPELTAEEYAALKADIQKRGRNLIPIVLDATTDEVIDGFHRSKACAELGIEPVVVKWNFKDEAERHEISLVLNLLRRQFGPDAWAATFLRLAEVRGIRIEPGGDRTKSQSETLESLAKSIGTPRATAFRRLKLHKNLRGSPDLAAKVDSGAMSAAEAVREAKKRRRAAEVNSTPLVVLPPEVFHGRFQDWELKSESIDLIFTDPPYGLKESASLQLWSDLSLFASRVLRPGSFLCVYASEAFLPDVIERLGENMEYLWVGAVELETPSRIHSLNLQQAVRTILFYGKPPIHAPEEEWFNLVKSSKREKGDHAWQQSVVEAEYFVSKLSPLGGLVADPMAGSGTTAIAAANLGRNYAIADMDEKALRSAVKRIEERKS